MIGVEDAVWLSCVEEFGSPIYVYSETMLKSAVDELLNVPHAFGFTPRFALKALPTRAILRLFNHWGVHFDVSSGFEIERALLAGIPPSHLSLSSQELPGASLLEGGVHFNACSLKQLSWFGKHFAGMDVGIRFNPGCGSSKHIKTNVGGKESAFGIWHEDVEAVKAIAKEHNLNIVRIHTHIGSGTVLSVWEDATLLSLDLVKQFDSVSILNLGGGFKVDRMNFSTTNLSDIGHLVLKKLTDFEKETRRSLHLELEPGTHLTALAGVLVASVQDILRTGADGHSFLKIDAGMTEILRPTMYDAPHPMKVIKRESSNEKFTTHYSIVGHCCESGDLISLRDNNDKLVPIELETAEIGDVLLIGGSGAYCSSMCAKNYNSFPEVAEILLRESGDKVLIRKKQTMAQIIQNEVDISL